jgi:hypothetical protein
MAQGLKRIEVTHGEIQNDHRSGNGPASVGEVVDDLILAQTSHYPTPARNEERAMTTNYTHILDLVKEAEPPPDGILSRTI